MIRAFSKYGWIFISAVTFGVVSLLWPALTLEGLAGLLVCVIVLLGTSIGAMLWPRVATVMLVFYIAGWAILAGIFKILTAFRIRKEIKGEWMLGISGLISILVGLILIFRPEAGVLAVAWLIGLYAIILGIFQLLLGLKFRKIGTGSTN